MFLTPFEMESTMLKLLYLCVYKQEGLGSILNACLHHDLLHIISPFSHAVIFGQFNLETLIICPKGKRSLWGYSKLKPPLSLLSMRCEFRESRLKQIVFMQCPEHMPVPVHVELPTREHVSLKPEIPELARNQENYNSIA